MAVVVAVPLFIAALGVTLVAAASFARRLDRLGARFGLPEVWIGLLTALAADGPEVSSALAALIKGSHEASIGVIVGSNTFNLAAMLGATVMLVGCVQVPRTTLALEGAVSLAATAVVIALLLGWVPVAAAAPLVAAVVAPYLVLVIGGYDLARKLGLRRLATLVAGRDIAAGAHSEDHAVADFATHRQLALIAVDLVVIVGGSFAMVQAALTLGTHWGIESTLVGTLILGPLTSLPNALTAIRLGRAGRGSALVTETLNSNTINLVAGVALPSTLVTLTARTAADQIDLALLAATMLATIGFLAARRGLRRPGAAIIIALYAAFIAATLT